MDKISPISDSNCILCINTKSKKRKLLNNRGHSLKIADILCQHFWFTFSETDKSKIIICVPCWKKTSTFHQFYESVREAHQHHNENQIKDEDSVHLEDEDSAQPEDEDSAQPEDEDSAQPDWQSDDFEADVAMNADEEDTSPQLESEDINLKANVNLLEPVVHADEDAPISQQPLDAVMSGTAEDAKQMCQRPDSLANVDENAEQTSQKSDPTTDREDIEGRIAEYFKMNCDLCGQKLSSLAMVKAHFSKEHKLDRGYLICCCNKKAKMRQSIIEHVQWHMNPSMFQCNECSKTFNEKQGLRKHKVKHHTHDDLVDCSVCAKQYKSKRLLAEHVARVHPPDDQKFTCDFCQKDFKLKVILEAHMKHMHIRVTQQYICDICAKVLSTKQNLREHTNTHFDIPRIKCNICGALLKNRVCLRIHMKSHSDVKQTCDICFEVKANRSALSNHKRRVHGAARHKCNFCEKAFTRLSALREHIATHTGQNLYTCKYCPQTFKCDSNMYKHLRQVHSEQWAHDRKRR